MDVTRRRLGEQLGQLSVIVVKNLLKAAAVKVCYDSCFFGEGKWLQSAQS